jgi:hypothetical protein
MVVRGFDENATVDVRVTDLAGRLVNNFTYDSQAGTMEFGKDLNNGIYLVTAQQGDKTSVTRIVKTN